MLSSFTKAIGTRNRCSAGSQDANPRIVTSYELYGSSISIPIPDIDRTDYFLCLGGNPMISNGSVMTAPDMRRRLRAVRERGGKVVVVDPRRTETAREADEHVAIRPGGDAAFLLAMARVLVERGRVDRRFLESRTSGWPDVERRLAAFTPTRVAAFAGVPADTIERLALEFAGARSGVCYSRVGVCVGRHPTAATYATDLLNIVAGRPGREGGPVFTTPAFDIGRVARMSGLDGHHRWQSRVRGLPETLGDLPSAVPAAEIRLELTERLGGGPLGEPWLDRPLRWLRPFGVRWTPTGFLNLILRLGPYGDRFLPWSDGLSLEKLKAAPHGVPVRLEPLHRAG